MKIQREKEIDIIRISHNKKLFWIIIVLLIVLGILIYFIVKNNTQENKNSECSVDSDCVVATCCHPDSCVSLEKKPDCKEILCSMDLSGPLEDGTGHCGCEKGKCSVVNVSENK